MCPIWLWPLELCNKAALLQPALDLAHFPVRKTRMQGCGQNTC